MLVNAKHSGNIVRETNPQIRYGILGKLNVVVGHTDFNFTSALDTRNMKKYIEHPKYTAF
jgi:hypothetical protein